MVPGTTGNTRSFPPAVAVMLAEFPAAGLCREFVEWMVSELDTDARELAPHADPCDETEHVVIPSGAGSEPWGGAADAVVNSF